MFRWQKKTLVNNRLTPINICKIIIKRCWWWYRDSWDNNYWTGKYGHQENKNRHSEFSRTMRESKEHRKTAQQEWNGELVPAQQEWWMSKPHRQVCVHKEKKPQATTHHYILNWPRWDPWRQEGLRSNWEVTTNKYRKKHQGRVTNQGLMRSARLSYNWIYVMHWE